MREVLIIGAGASGLTAAIAAAGAGARVTVLEKDKKAGRKLLLTGNGRCNLTHTDERLWDQYHSASPEALEEVCACMRGIYDSAWTVRFFEDLGLPCRDREGYVYPATMQASSVLHVLLGACRRLGVKIKLDQDVTQIRKDAASGRWQAVTPGWTYEADSLILCCGSKAGPAGTGSSGGYQLAKMAGHTITGPLPALTGLTCAGEQLAACKGARTDGSVTLTWDRGRQHLTEMGQIQWTGDGVSGIVVFQLAYAASALLAAGRQEPALHIDLYPERTAAQLEEQMKRNVPADPADPANPADPADPADGKSRADRPLSAQQIQELLRGMVHERLAGAVRARAAREGDLCVRTLALALKDLCFTVTGTDGFEHAQVCAGGVPLTQIYPDTFESRLQSGLYLAGELLDADGPCGGYNLQWAFTTGFVAGTKAGEEKS